MLQLPLLANVSSILSFLFTTYPYLVKKYKKLVIGSSKDNLFSIQDLFYYRVNTKAKVISCFRFHRFIVLKNIPGILEYPTVMTGTFCDGKSVHDNLFQPREMLGPMYSPIGEYKRDFAVKGEYSRCIRTDYANCGKDNGIIIVNRSYALRLGIIIEFKNGNIPNTLDLAQLKDSKRPLNGFLPILGVSVPDNPLSIIGNKVVWFKEGVKSGKQYSIRWTA
jgi:hypothetical protein